MVFTVHRKADRSAGIRADRFLCLLSAAGAAEIFLLTEDMTGPVLLTDSWTAQMLATLAVGLILAYLTRHSGESKANA